MTVKTQTDVAKNTIVFLQIFEDILRRFTQNRHNIPYSTSVLQITDIEKDWKKYKFKI